MKIIRISREVYTDINLIILILVAINFMAFTARSEVRFQCTNELPYSPTSSSNFPLFLLRYPPVQTRNRTCSCDFQCFFRSNLWFTTDMLQSSKHVPLASPWPFIIRIFVVEIFRIIPPLTAIHQSPGEIATDDVCTPREHSAASITLTCAFRFILHSFITSSIAKNILELIF